MAALECEFENKTKQYLQEECDHKGNPKINNLTSNEQEGLRELIELIKNNKKVVTVTDKSDKLFSQHHRELPNHGSPAYCTWHHSPRPGDTNQRKDPQCVQFPIRQNIKTMQSLGQRYKHEGSTNEHELEPPRFRFSVKYHKKIQPG